MDFLYKDTNKRMNLCEVEKATHVLMTMEEYNSKCRTIENMQRILREKQNANRGLEPKKQRSGYVLLGYDTNDFRLKFEKETATYECRRLLLESPYGVSLSYKEAYDFILEDLLKLCGAFGATTVIEKSAVLNVEMANTFFNINSEKMLFITGLEAQRSGLWSVRLYANFTPDIPADFIKEQQKRGE